MISTGKFRHIFQRSIADIDSVAAKVAATVKAQLSDRVARSLFKKFALFLAASFIYSGENFTLSVFRQKSNIQVGYRQRIAFNKFAPRLNLIAHQRRENIICALCIVDAYLNQTTRRGIDRCVP
jgi:hypothetical protein